MTPRDPIMNNQVYHVYNRGNNRMTLFKTREEYQVFLESLFQDAVRWSVRIVAYTLMPNHFHLLLIQSPGGSIRSLMHALSTSTAKRYNLKHHHVGHVFQDTYKHVGVDLHGLADTARYIHLNPVKAGLARAPEDWPYSSFKDLLAGSQDSSVEPHDPRPILTAAGGSIEANVAHVRAAEAAEAMHTR